MLNLYKLQIFTLVAEEGSITAAAKRLYMAQASVSQHIKELESSLGVILFERGRRGVTLTEVGERLHTRAVELLRLAAQTESEITDVHNLETATLAVCGTPGLTTFFFPNWLRDFRADFPHVDVALKTGTTSDINGWVRQRLCDIGFTEGKPNTAQVQALSLEEIRQFVVVGPDHPWWGRDSVRIADLHGQQMITRQPASQSRVWVESVLADHQVEVDVVAVFDAVEPIKRSVSISNRCFTVLPDYSVQTEIEAGQLRSLSVIDATLTRQLWLVRHLTMPVSAVARSFLHSLAHRFPALAAF